jgi:leader peptidase (prepilin peptidase)/N-methyltransferase
VFAALVSGLGAFGLVFGSFLNVVIYRVPRGESIVAPRSRCPKCGTTLGALDNIPVVSYVVLGGRCRTCRAPISAQYPIVELSTAGLFAGTAARFGYSWPLPAYVVLAAGLLVLAAIDLEQGKLPKQIVYLVTILVLALLGLASGETGDWRRLVVAACAGAAWFGLFFAINAVNPRWLGFGDVRLALCLGLSLGWLGVGYVFVGFLLASLVGTVVGIGLIVAKGADLKTQVPFGPFLAIGTEMAVFAGSLILRPFHVG